MNKKLLSTLLVLLVGTSCTDLDLLPSNGAVDNKTFINGAAYRSYLAKIYAAFSLTGRQGPSGQPDITLVSDEGFTSYIRAYWKAQELTTDEAVIAWSDAGIRDLHDLSWSSENQFVRVIYYRLFLIIAYANDFLGQSTPDKMDQNGVPQADRAAIEVYRAEARFLRALAYWHALDLFRNVVVYQQITSTLQEQSTPAETFQFIESELDAIDGLLADARQNEYGRADRAAAWMLKAKLFLNAEVYIQQDRFADALTECEKIIAAGYSLAPVYENLFRADNHQYGVDGSSPNTEFILTLPQDGNESQSWGSTTFLVHAAIGGTMVPADYGVTGPWAGLRTTSDMIAKFSGATIPVARDPRAMFYTSGQTLDIADVGVFAQGYAVPKYKNITSTGNPGVNVTHVDIDYPLFRLADVYLMYAEAHLRGGGGSLSTATNYMNLIRERAYGNTTANIVEADLTLDYVLNERVREMYFEGCRRIDLIRFGKFSGPQQITWPWKGGVAAGKNDTESYRNIFPIPATDLAANPNMEQNDGY